MKARALIVKQPLEAESLLSHGKAMMGRGTIAAGVALTTIATAVAAQTQKLPYYASIRAGEARMRVGPGRNYPVSWLYLRPGLPVKVVMTQPSWRKIEDPDGTQGWMQANLLSETRTAIVRAGGVRQLREIPAAGARVVWRVEPRVVGTISRCGNGWCRFDVLGRAGFIEVAELWGVEPGEAVD